MTFTKRFFDLLLAIPLSIVLLPAIILIAGLIYVVDGRPIFYVSERMKTPDRGFQLVKFRTMRLASADTGVSGGDKTSRITPLGRFLRKHRLDEFPQLWNVLKGDMSFVGPRPPLRQYVERFPETYERVLRSRPGITGLASVYVHEYEERLLSRTASPEETDRIYCRTCIPRKARLDRIYQENASLCLDVWIVFRTLGKGIR